MAADKRRRLRLPPHIQRLLAFGAFAASLEIPPEQRDRKMAAGLKWIIDLLHREGYAAPLFLFKPYRYFRRGMEDLDSRPGPRPMLMLMLAEQLVEDLPAGERYAAMQDLLSFFRVIYRAGNAELPEWLRLGLQQYGLEE